MKLFLDTADRKLIKEWVPTGIIDGVTTNPSLLSKEGSSTKEVLLDICKMVDGDVSIEVVEKDPDAVYKQAKEISSIASNVVVKIPFQKEYLSVIKKLSDEGIAINVTLVFSVVQAMLVAKLGVRYISPFIGRWDDIDVDGLGMIEELRQVLDNYGYTSQILAASVRHMMHLHYSMLIGADVATVPPSLFNKLMKHPLTISGIEQFDSDWKKSGNKTLL